MNDLEIRKILHDCKTFDDVYTITKDLTNNEKGYLFERITYYLFKLSPMLNDHEELWMYDDIPNRIKKLLKLPEKDKGIDILMKKDGSYFPIQCKFRQDSNVVISWSELSTFFGLSFGMNKHIYSGFLVTNTYDLCDEVINSEKVETIYGDYFNNLPENFFNNICNIINGNKITSYTIKKEYDYQRICVENTYNYFINHKLEYKEELDYKEESDYEESDYKDDEKNNYDRAFIEMACGTGKSITSYFIDKKMNNKKTLVLVPSLHLLSQFYCDWINQSYAEDVYIKYILVGSDADVDEEVKQKSNGLLLTTDTKYINDILKNIKKIK